ncbi:M81 family metallopeptidase [Schaalia sp. lx-100]|uniref:M81 family metallopeptidase n=1 Tax=Schaalia sp. lx-100 TaxID=2899081 RepID=UPI001E46F67C|nr:M81 family metallopeptidase [Schaalia sp. lx-100]MCD4557421.1 M81 family metallopeptidase [Schaalia sp. lx-100]
MCNIPRIAICGIHIESSTFTPYISSADDFIVTRGETLINRYSWRNDPWARQVEWIPILHARALPGGVVQREAYESWKEEIIAGLREIGQIEGLFFDIHGAMSVEGMDDAEGDLITAIREVIGSTVVVSASMDLHGNVSDVLFDSCDLMTCYRKAPHEDALESRERAAHNLVNCVVAGGKKPAKALVHVPVLLPGEKTSTRMEPARSLYDMMYEAEALPGVTDGGIWIGFAWADQPRCKGAVVIYGDDATVVKEQAERIGRAFWDARDEFCFVAPVGSMQECLEWALTAKRPTFISDSGDNPGAGGANDVTAALSALCAWEPVQNHTLRVIHASIVDPEAVAICWEKGVGAQVDIHVGGHIDRREPGPQAINGIVEALVDDPDGGHTAAVRTGGLTVIITSRRNQYTTHQQFARLNLDVRHVDVVVVKMGYLEPALYNAQRDWRMALTPGGVDQDLVRLGHQKIERPMVPFDQGFETPIHARLVSQ